MFIWELVQPNLPKMASDTVRRNLTEIARTVLVIKHFHPSLTVCSFVGLEVASNQSLCANLGALCVYGEPLSNECLD